MRNKISILILGILALGFFISTGSYIYLSQKGGFIKWSSPDETANYYFSKLYAQQGKLSAFEKNNLYAKEIIHPRSFRSDWGELKPVSFIGLPLVYGKIGALTTWKMIGYLTPIFAAIGIIYYYLLMRIFFSRRVALFSAFILSVFPVYVYYSARSMFHNVIFTVFLIIGLYYVFISVPAKPKRPENKIISEDNGEDSNASQSAQEKTVKEKKFFKWEWVRLKYLLFSALGGIFIGLAITARSSELLWLGPMLIFIWIFNFWRFGISRLAVFISTLAIAMMPMLYWNNILYGSPIRGGYPEMNKSITTATGSGVELVKTLPALTGGSVEPAKNLALEIKRTIFSFGFNLPRAKMIFKLYFVKMFPWLFWGSLAGAFLFILHAWKLKKKHVLYLLSFTAISIVLIIYYGSWEFYDNPDRSAATIGNSYTRYWLPVYLGAIPFASYLLFKIVDSPKVLMGQLEKIGFLKNTVKDIKMPVRIFRAFMVGLAVIIIFQISVLFTLFGSEEGLVPTYYKSIPARAEYISVLNLTEEDAVIITRYHDKLLFPERRVVMGQFDDPNMVLEYTNIAGHAPLYYYNFSYKPAAVEYLNNGLLAKANLRMKKIEQITKDFTLYKLELVKPNAKTKN